MSPEKKPVSFRLSDDAADMIRMLANNMGVSQAAVVEMAVKEKAMRAAKEGYAVVKKWYDSLSPQERQALREILANNTESR